MIPKTTFYSVVLFAMLFSDNIYGQNYEWANVIYDTPTESAGRAEDVYVDDSGNAIATGLL